MKCPFCQQDARLTSATTCISNFECNKCPCTVLYSERAERCGAPKLVQYTFHFIHNNRGIYWRFELDLELERDIKSWADSFYDGEWHHIFELTTLPKDITPNNAAQKFALYALFS